MGAQGALAKGAQAQRGPPGGLASSAAAHGGQHLTDAQAPLHTLLHADCLERVRAAAAAEQAQVAQASRRCLDDSEHCTPVGVGGSICYSPAIPQQSDEQPSSAAFHHAAMKPGGLSPGASPCSKEHRDRFRLSTGPAAMPRHHAVRTLPLGTPAVQLEGKAWRNPALVQM